MPFGAGPSVNQYRGCDCWRTWFIEECESAQLFGVTKRHLGLITLEGVGIESYRVGTRVYLEDAPFFRGSRTHHRVCGPYEVFSLPALPDGGKSIHIIKDKIIVFEVAHPARGPWLNRKNVIRNIEDIKVKFNQIANRFDYFPYRFAIRRASKFHIQRIAHTEKACTFCQ